jgi:hypothetical protein
MQKNLTRGLARGPNNPESKTWPGAAELVLLRIIGAVWSTSDFSHPVVVPALLLMGQYLSQARIRRMSDLGAGLFMVSILAQVSLSSSVTLSYIADGSSMKQNLNGSYPKQSTSSLPPSWLYYLVEKIPQQPRLIRTYKPRLPISSSPLH